MMKMSLSKKFLILGANGLIGEPLFSLLKKEGLNVTGTAREKSNKKKGLILFNITTKSVKAFDWKKFDIIVDCTGVVNYRDDPAAAKGIISGNIINPLLILAELNKSQHYFYLGTHAVLIPPGKSTAYARSKNFFEEFIRLSKNISPKVTILRIPAVFSEKREVGLIQRIKKHFLQKEKLELNLSTFTWHTMYLPRIASIITAIISGNPEEKVITIGYPTETSVEKIIKSVETAFGYSIPINFIKNESDHYIPDVSSQQIYISVSANDFEKDLLAYFKK